MVQLSPCKVSTLAEKLAVKVYRIDLHHHFAIEGSLMVVKAVYRAKKKIDP